MYLKIVFLEYKKIYFFFENSSMRVLKVLKDLKSAHTNTFPVFPVVKKFALAEAKYH